VTLLVAKGNGVKDLPRFSTTGDWSLHYAFDCRAFGSKGNFVVTDSGDNFGIYANQLATKGADTSSESSTGSIKLSVNSECAWTIKATEP
jgi:hypothetical protein